MSLSKIFVNNTQVIEVDKEPAISSNNLVNSDGIANQFEYVNANILGTSKIFEEENQYFSSSNPKKVATVYGKNMIYCFIPANISTKIVVTTTSHRTIGIGFAYEYPRIGTYLYDVAAPLSYDINNTVIEPVSYNRYYCVGYVPDDYPFSISLINTNSFAENIYNLISEGYSYYGIASKDENFLDRIQLSSKKSCFFLIASPGHYAAWNKPEGVDFTEDEVPCIYKKSANTDIWNKDYFLDVIKEDIASLKEYVYGSYNEIILQDLYFAYREDHYIITYQLNYKMICFYIKSNLNFKIIIKSSNRTLGVGFTDTYPMAGVVCHNVDAILSDLLNGTIIEAVDYDRYYCVGYSIISQEDNFDISLICLDSISYILRDVNTRLNNLTISSIKAYTNNSSDLLMPVSSYSGGATNLNKFGMYWENIIGKSIIGIHLKSFANGNLKYGIGNITNNIVGNFSEVGSIVVKDGEYDYLFYEPVVLQTNQALYLQGARLYGAGQINNLNSFIDGFQSNDITKTNFTFSYYLILAESLESYIDNVNKKIEENEERITDLESEIGNVINYCAVGDSVTAGAYGEGWTPEDLVGLSYADYLQVLIGSNQFVKKAVGGYSIYNNMNNLISNISNTINLITICLGLNDITLHLNQSVEIGDYVQIIKHTATTDFTDINFYGNNILGRYRWCLEKVKNLHPNAKIIAISMPHERLITQESIDVWNNIKYGECAICNFLSIPYLDFQSTSPIFTAHADSTKPNWNDFLHDGCHPEKEGYHMMATAIYSLLKGLI